jgi:hypothetical protein
MSFLAIVSLPAGEAYACPLFAAPLGVRWAGCSPGGGR